MQITCVMQLGKSTRGPGTWISLLWDTPEMLVV